MSEQRLLDSNLKYPWQKVVLDAVMELMPERLPDKIYLAEGAISARLVQTPTDSAEQLALRDASFALKILQRVILQA